MKISVTDILAWIGALTGTAALLWDFYKWKASGPKLKVTVVPHMSIYTCGRPESEDTYLLIKVANTGTRKTTITTLGFVYYQSRLKRILKKPSKRAIVPDPKPGELPHVLDAGEEWSGLAIQNDIVEEQARRGYLYCCVFHSLGNKPVNKRVVISET